MRRSSYTSSAVAVWAGIAITASYVLGADRSSSKTPGAELQSVDLFAGMNSGDLKVKFIPKNDREGQVLIENTTKQPLSVKLPSAFAGVPVLAQIGAGGGGRQRNSNSNNNQNQSTGGGFGGGGGGFGGGGFNVAPESVGKIKVPLVCLEHGKDEPNSRVPYEIRSIESYTKDARVHELLNMLGEGNLDQKAAQAAAWHFANNISWEELNAKRIHHLGGRPDERYFTPEQMQMATQIATEADRLAKLHPPKEETPNTTDSYSAESVSYSAGDK